MNIEILEKNPNHCANEMSTPILKTLLSKSENKDIFQKKRDSLLFLTLSCKIPCTNDDLRLFLSPTLQEKEFYM